MCKYTIEVYRKVVKVVYKSDKINKLGRKW